MCLVSHASEKQIYHRVLVIYGNADVGVWEQDFNQAMHRHLNLDFRTKLSLEFLELNYVEQKDYPVLSESVAIRHKLTPPDLIVGVQPAASDFVRNWAQNFAPDVPLLYILPGPETVKHVLKTGRGNYLGTAWPHAITKTLLSMRQLLPQLRHLYVVSGTGTSDLSYLNRARDIITRLNSESANNELKQIEIHYLVGLPPADIVATLSHETTDSAILLLSYSRSQSDNRYRTIDISTLLRKQTSLPIFGSFDSLIGWGIIGGNLTSATYYGEKAAELSESILAGDPISNQETTQTRFIYDAEQLRHFNIPLENLPESAIILNGNPSIWSQYWQQLIFGFAIILIQFLFILALFRALKNQKTAEHERDHQITKTADQTRLFESVINGIQDAIIICDAKQNIVATNSIGFAKTFGYGPEEMIGHQVSELVSDPEDELLDLDLSEQLSEKPRIYTFYNAQAQPFSGETVGTEILDNQGNMSGYFAFVRDITDRINKEDELRQAHKMEALGNLAGGIAHDFNNILMAIIGNAEVAIYSTDQKDVLDDCLSGVLMAGERARDLVSSILTFSRQSEHNEFIRVDIAESLQESIALLQASLPSSIELTCDIEPDLWDISADKVQIQQVIMNLCTNAHHAIPAAGKLIVHATNKNFKTNFRSSRGDIPAGNYVVLGISDTGTGIKPEILQRIFEPFFTTKAPGEGTGMGLALVYGIMESHGAYLDVESTIDVGTRFTLYFPALAVSEQIDSPNEKVVLYKGSGQRIMIIDDDKMVIATNRKTLTMLGYEIEAFTDPQDALKAFESAPDKFDLVLSDQTMPVMNGTTLLTAIKITRAEIPVILCTGHRDAADSQAEQLQLDAILLKPFSINELSATLSSLLKS